MENKTIKNIEEIEAKLNEKNNSIKYQSLVIALLTIVSSTVVPFIAIPFAILGIGGISTFLISKMHNEALSKTVKDIIKEMEKNKELQNKVDHVLKSSDPNDLNSLNKNLSKLLIEN